MIWIREVLPLLIFLAPPVRPIFELIDSSGLWLLLLPCVLVNLSNEGDVPYDVHGEDGVIDDVNDDGCDERHI